MFQTSYPLFCIHVLIVRIVQAVAEKRNNIHVHYVHISLHKYVYMVEPVYKYI